MRKLLTLALVLAFVVGSALPGHATEFKAKGKFDFSFLLMTDTMFNIDKYNKDEDSFQARQRARIQVDAIVSENLKGVLYFEIGENQWGYPGSGSAIGTDGVNVETKRAYIAFNVPDTDLMFQVGLQGIALPDAVAGNPVLDDDMAGVIASLKVNDMISIVAAWARLYDLDQNGHDLPASPDFDEVDAFALIIPITGDGWSFIPYAMYANVGRDALVRIATGQTKVHDGPTRLDGILSPVARTGLTHLPVETYAYYASGESWIPAWWLGAAIEVSLLDPLVFKADLIYGSSHPKEDILSRKGLYVAAEIDYKLDFMTAALFGWYSTGEDGNWKNGSEQLPMVQSGFGPTSFIFDGSDLLEGGGSIANRNGPEGKWAIGAALKDITFIEDLTHTLRFVYSRGTNAPSSRHANGVVPGLPTIGYATNRPYPGFATSNTEIENVFMTTDDYLIEVNFDHKYMIYENLAVILELGYAHLGLGGSKQWYDTNTQDAWKAGLGLQYSF